MCCYYVRGVVSVAWQDSKVEDSIASTRRATTMEHAALLAVFLPILTRARSLLFEVVLGTLFYLSVRTANKFLSLLLFIEGHNEFCVGSGFYLCRFTELILVYL